MEENKKVAPKKSELDKREWNNLRETFKTFLLISISVVCTVLYLDKTQNINQSNQKEMVKLSAKVDSINTNIKNIKLNCIHKDTIVYKIIRLKK